ncbi:MAG: metallophosphoesterase family protein [Candidatus Omnitrophica bacterium]|nr:metallophosphoesterase family protein [Candidatus Omnitrophota bacterium]
MKSVVRITLFTLMVSMTSQVCAHNGMPSVHDTVAGIIDRMKKHHAPEALDILTPNEVWDFVTEQDKQSLATQFLKFQVNVPVVVTVMQHRAHKDDPFWLTGGDFKKTDLIVVYDGKEYNVWQREYDAGEIGLGVNSLFTSGEGYFVAIRPRIPQDKLEITGMYPAYHTIGEMKVGERAYFDDWDELEVIPEELQGQTLIRGTDDNKDVARLSGVFRLTPYPATEEPDHIVLTWSEDPKTTQTIQWRTSPAVSHGTVKYLKKSDYHNFNPKEPKVVEAETSRIEDMYVVNDSVNNHHTAILRDLEPGTEYVYAVGDGSDDGWSEIKEFKTAPEGNEPFSFFYMGDAQNGLERWGSLIQKSYLAHPDSAFYVMAGDLVNRGAERDDWDVYFENAEGVFDHRQVVPCPGNHEYHGGDCTLYREHFALPTNGSPNIHEENSYVMEYSNAIFIVLDSNLEPETQTEWLEEQLKNTDKTWKFVVYHHPAYSSGPSRDNPEIRKLWGDIFDKYHVDIALQGHDHAYLRTYPMYDQKRVETAADGTIYIVSVSGTKFYDQGDFDYKEFGMTKVATYQVLDILISGDKLIYRAYDQEGNVRDDFVIEK